MPEKHRQAFALARSKGLQVTIHAGEAAGAKSIDHAIRHCGAQLLGHGVALRDEPLLLEKVINAGKQIQELSKYFQKTAAGDDNDIATAAFYNGEAAILIQGSWAIGQINGSCAEGFADKVGVFAFPAVDGSSADPNRVIAKSDSLCMSADTEYPDAAIQLIKYFVDDTASKYTAEVGGKIPVTNVQYDENLKFVQS